MKLGKLNFVPVEQNWDLVADQTKKVIGEKQFTGVIVTEIDPSLADTAAFCERHDIGLDISVNCVIVEAKRADRTWYAACLVKATERADMNGIVRKHLDARRLSFAPTDTAVSLSGMEFGGITPIGLPADWKILVDKSVVSLEYVVIGSGIRKSKLLVRGKLLGSLPNSEVKMLPFS